MTIHYIVKKNVQFSDVLSLRHPPEYYEKVAKERKEQHHLRIFGERYAEWIDSQENFLATMNRYLDIAGKAIAPFYTEKTRKKYKSMEGEAFAEFAKAAANSKFMEDVMTKAINDLNVGRPSRLVN